MCQTLKVNKFKIYKQKQRKRTKSHTDKNLSILIMSDKNLKKVEGGDTHQSNQIKDTYSRRIERMKTKGDKLETFR